ncbi:MAG: PASTA domain-containing protein [Rikenellaceae bacterium]
MKKKKTLFQRISSHFLLRQAILVVCSVIVLLVLTSFLLNVFTRHWQKYEVPEVLGKTLSQATKLGEDAELEFVVIDSLYVVGLQPGSIITQSPHPDSKVKSGRKIFVVINSVSPRSEVIPYVAGYSLRGAKNILQSKGFEIAELIYVNDMATNNVISQSYKGQNIDKNSTLKAKLGEGITLRVGKNSSAPLPIVPNVAGVTLREAKSRIWEVGLNVGQVIRDADVTDLNLGEAKVYKQVPARENRLDYGGKVTLYLSADSHRVETGQKRSEDDMRKAREGQVQDEIEIDEQELKGDI